MADQEYFVGSVANSHVLTSAKEWLPVEEAITYIGERSREESVALLGEDFVKSNHKRAAQAADAKWATHHRAAKGQALRSKTDLDVRTDALIGQLASTKYESLISGGRMKSFSFVGTGDWQDYLDVGLQVLQLEYSQEVSSQLSRIEELLTRLVAALTDDKIPESSGD